MWKAKRGRRPLKATTEGGKRKSEESTFIPFKKPFNMDFASSFSKSRILNIFSPVSFVNCEPSKLRLLMNNKAEEDIINEILQTFPDALSCSNAVQLKQCVEDKCPDEVKDLLNTERESWANICGNVPEDVHEKGSSVLYEAMFYAVKEAEKTDLEFGESARSFKVFLQSILDPDNKYAEAKLTPHSCLTSLWFRLFYDIAKPPKTKTLSTYTAMQNGQFTPSFTYVEQGNRIQNMNPKPDAQLHATFRDPEKQFPVIVVECKTIEQLEQETTALLEAGEISTANVHSTGSDVNPHTPSQLPGNKPVEHLDEMSADAHQQNLMSPPPAHAGVKAKSGFTEPIIAKGTTTPKNKDTRNAPKTSEDTRRLNMRMESLQTQHFLELYGALQVNVTAIPRASVFGFYFVQNRVFPTCLQVVWSERPESTNVLQNSITSFIHANSAATRKDRAKDLGFSYKMSACKRYLDMFVASHWTALLWYIQYLVFCEKDHMDLQSATRAH